MWLLAYLFSASLLAHTYAQNYDSRCKPVIRIPSSICNETCNNPCRFGQICCPSQCGSSCTFPLEDEILQCPPLVNPGRSLIIVCTDNRNIGSICTISCPENKELAGNVNTVTCRVSGVWSRTLSRSACVKPIIINNRCPRILPEATVSPRPCNNNCPKFCGTGSICCRNPNGCGSSCVRVPSPGESLYDGRCPERLFPDARPTPGQCQRCPRRCGTGQICCPYTVGCGERCVDTPRQELYHPRCPVSFVPPSSGCTPGCSRPCRAGFICCPDKRGCGSCMLDRPAQNPDCPARPRVGSGVSFSRCTNDRKLFSTCQVTCQNGQILQGGVIFITCIPPGEWTHNVEELSCVYDERCPPRRVRRQDEEDVAALSRVPLVLCPQCGPTCPGEEICCPITSSDCGSRCTAIPPTQCPDLTTPPNSGLIISCTNERNVGSVCSVSCPSGFDLRGGVDEVQCMDSGVWSIELVRSACVRPHCSSLNGLNPSVEPSCSRGNRVGSVCIINCASHEHVLLRGNRHLVCNNNERWNQVLSRITCGFDRRCPRAPLFGTCGRCPRRCPSGQLCCSTGCGSTCTRLQCPELRYSSGSRITLRCSRGRYVGSRCETRCRSGYRLSRGGSATCQRDQTWSRDISRARCNRCFIFC